MDFFRQQLVIIQDRLRGLTPSQQMLAAALVVIMAMTMLYWGNFASGRDMVPLATVSTDGAERQAAIAVLAAKGIRYTDSGGILSVPADQQSAAIAAIGGAVASAPGQTANELESMLEKLSPLSTQGEFKARDQVARTKTLQAMMLQWPGVARVQVQIMDSVRGGLTPTPSGVLVSIGTKPGADPRKIANAALASVLPIIPNLKREAVTVMVDGVPRISAGSNGGGGLGNGELIEVKTSYEISVSNSIKSFYNTIPGLQVSVHADVNAETKLQDIKSFDTMNKVSLPTQTSSEKTSTTDGGPVGEPGAVPNMGLDANAPLPVARGGTKMERTEETFDNRVGETKTSIQTPAGQARILGATVRVPREHFLKIWKYNNKDVEPTPEQLDSLVARETGRMRAELMTNLQIKDETSVVVNDYIGFEDPTLFIGTTAVATAGTSGESLSLMAGAHGKEVAIGALALTSLFMVGRMVKKASPAPVAPLLTLDDMPDITPTKRKPGTIGTMEIAGEVGEGGVVMTGRELDEEVLETSQMVDQVSGFVKDNPEMTAQLLKRWMNRD